MDSVGSGIIGSSEWHTTDIEVRIRDSHDDPALAGQQAIIRGISVSDSASILDKIRHYDIGNSYIRIYLILFSKNDTCLFVTGWYVHCLSTYRRSSCKLSV